MNFMDAIPGLKVLDEAGIKKLYFTALEVLERTGVSVAQKEPCELLNDAGAKVEDEVAYVPAWLVEKAVNSAPKQIIIYTIDACCYNCDQFGRGAERSGDFTTEE